MATLASVHEAHGEQVRAFGEAVHAAAGVNQITDAVIAIATSDAWHDYILDGHGAAWLGAEFDYFLIACGVRYVDMVEVLKWRSDTQLLAPLMDQKADARRPLKVASAGWDSPLAGVTLIALARELGWVTDRGRARKPPVGRRARARAHDGMSREQRAARARRERIGEARCAELEQLATAVVVWTRNWDERRFVADEILHDR
jgi:hypothetical protein